MVRVASVFLLVCLCFAAAVSAQEAETELSALAPNTVVVSTQTPEQLVQLPLVKRPSLLTSFYISTAALQAALAAPQTVVPSMEAPEQSVQLQLLKWSSLLVP